MGFSKSKIESTENQEQRVIERSSRELGISIGISISTCNQVVILHSASDSLKRDHKVDVGQGFG